MYRSIVNLFSCLRQCWEPLKPAAIEQWLKALEWKQIDSRHITSSGTIQCCFHPAQEHSTLQESCSPSNQVFSSRSILNGKSSCFVSFPLRQFPFGQCLQSGNWQSCKLTKWELTKWKFNEVGINRTSHTTNWRWALAQKKCLNGFCAFAQKPFKHFWCYQIQPTSAPHHCFGFIRHSKQDYTSGGKNHIVMDSSLVHRSLQM